MSAQANPVSSPTRISFSQLDGWGKDDQSAALDAFRRSCARILKLSPSAPLDVKGGDPLYGKAGDWQPACRAATGSVGPGAGNARGFFQHWFVPVKFPSERGLFTGYYEPEMRGSLTRGGVYQTPVLAPPPGFSMVAGGGNFPTRAEIEDGALDTDKLALLWLESPIDAFFLHVQGSGRVRLPNDEIVRLSFAAKTGHDYTSIGKLLVERGEMKLEQVSMQTIRAWMEKHPAEGRALMRQNKSYIFFRILRDVDETLGPPGAEQVNLTPGRSLAVDRSHHPLGTLLWLTTTHPTVDGQGLVPMARLMVAQDTGSAIKGRQRGDIFFGSGRDPGEIAGRMKAEGEFIALVPKEIAP
ncbi:MltA domain protein [Parvibaculum lavamentivorans DS-1]|uniref:peptidoglycan lytic exotransglycosylase n=1 Tax=Parvibaculum lavamentivorans (strain DS-1 / DSM 13023 / NCIMB 13966) TaxID=402881 RepID=A7HSI4_PARL1|nr:murein transglycosylase A [Parvibaculum lavamentivorans]ABS62867.1 MltA domain protein [Parvibaculum lavamentivorans DS-1]